MDAARPLPRCITDFEFIAVLVIVRMVLGYTRGLTVKLQGVGSDLVKTSNDVSFYCNKLFFFFFFFYIWLDFYRQAQFHVTTPQRVIRLCIIANSAAHTSPGCVHSNSYRRSSPGGSLTIRAGHCIAMPHDPDTLAQH